MRHVFVCTTMYGKHFAGTIAKKQAQAEKMSDEDRERIANAVPEEHADGHVGAHCGEKIGGGLYEAFRTKLAERDIRDVLLSPNACIAQHIAGCIVMVYPDGIWYAVDSIEAVDRIIDEHLVAGEVVTDLVHRRLGDSDGDGLGCMLATVAT